jgi:hypothetical protein
MPTLDHEGVPLAYQIRGSGDPVIVYFLDHGLSSHLQELASEVEVHPATDDRKRNKDKVIEMLKSRDVHFPAFISRKVH